MYYLGYDIGSSSIKAALIDAATNKKIGVAHYPDSEMDIASPQTGWAEQDPETWWENACMATQKLIRQTGVNPQEINGIGISYQMHGLVMVDKDLKVIRPSIIWCDSRAIRYGEAAFEAIGAEKCQQHLLNSPANFTAAKLKWVRENEPENYKRIYKIMLPGDFIALRLTGRATTTVSGLSEGIFWDFLKNQPADFLLDYMGFDAGLLAEVVPTFGNQGEVTAAAAQKLGVRKGIQVGYRAGDQPNNALSLGVLNPGEIAATGGTSGVVYGVQDQPVYDLKSRVNSFAHVNHESNKPRIGVLLCINGSGIQYRWVKQMMADAGLSYGDLEQCASSVPVGAEGLRMIPFGNGAERMLGNKDLGGHISNIQFNRHTKSHFYRAALEGIAFSFMYGMEVLEELGLDISKLRVGNDNLFQSTLFSDTISSLSNAPIEMVETTGAVGAARGAAYAAGAFSSLEEATRGDELIKLYEPKAASDYREAYDDWKSVLDKCIS